jgi:hypothetical protein
VSGSTIGAGGEAVPPFAEELISSGKEIRVFAVSERSRSIWDLAEKAQAEVDKWPEWKRRAADTALVTRVDREPKPTSRSTTKEPST